MDLDIHSQAIDEVRQVTSIPYGMYGQCYQSHDFGTQLGYFGLHRCYKKSSTDTSLLLGYFVISDRKISLKAIESGDFIWNRIKMILKGFCVSFSSISLTFQKETIGNSINSLTKRVEYPYLMILSNTKGVDQRHRWSSLRGDVISVHSGMTMSWWGMP